MSLAAPAAPVSVGPRIERIELHRHAACAAPRFSVLEYFHDHARIEAMLFEGAARPARGLLGPDPGEPGLGMAFRRADAARYAL